MNIRTKMISLLALLFAVLIALEIGVQRQVLMPSFAQLEREDADTSMKRIAFALDMTLESLELTAADWGNWADVYQIRAVAGRGFRQAPISRPVAMKQLKVNAMLIVDLNGRYVLSSARSLETGAAAGSRSGGAQGIAGGLSLAQELGRGQAGERTAAHQPGRHDDCRRAGAGRQRRRTTHGDGDHGQAAHPLPSALDRRAGAGQPHPAAGYPARRRRGDRRDRCVDAGRQALHGRL